MLRKTLLALAALIVLAVGVFFALLATNSDIIIAKFNDYVTQSTGAPLSTEKPPEITLFPNRGLEIGAGRWEKPDGTMSISFSSASIQISSHALFTGKFSIKNFSVEDLSVTLRVEDSLLQRLAKLRSTFGYQPPDQIVRFILRSLRIAPDNVTIRRGSIRVIQPDGSSFLLSPFSFSASNVHPGSDTVITLRALASSEQSDFRASVDVQCTALFTEKKASFTIAHAQLDPEGGMLIHRQISLSGGLEYDFASSGLELSQLQFQSSDVSLTASGSIASLGKMYQDSSLADASLTLEVSGAPQRVAEVLDTPLPFANQECFSNLELGAELRWAENRLQMNNIQGKADDLTFSGTLYTDLDDMDISGDLAFGSIDLDSYLADADTEQQVRPNPTEQDFSSWPRLSLQFSAEEITWNKIRLQDVHARLAGQNGAYEINPLSGTLLGSPLTASVSARILSSSSPAALLAMNASLPQVDLAELCQLAMEEPLFQGTGTLNASLSFNSYRGLPSLNGRGSLTSTKARTSFRMLPSGIPLTGVLSHSGDLNQLFCSFNIRGGSMELNSLSMAAPHVSLNCAGKIALPEKTLDLSGTARVPGISAFPVHIQGDIASPRYTEISAEQRAQSHSSSGGNVSRHLSRLVGRH